jgi:hypothetical protein
MSTDELAVPPGLGTIYRRFQSWRKSHPGRLPIPERLWAAATQAARDYGVSRTAQILRLDYSKLKRKLESSPAEGRERKVRGPITPFVELLPASVAGISECWIELEAPRGKMRIQWKGTGTPDWGGLSRNLWESK